MWPQLSRPHCFHHGKRPHNVPPAPSRKLTFPRSFASRFVHPVDKNDIGAQVRMAAQCCKLTDIMIAQCDHLWTVPQRLIEQARQMNTKSIHGKRQAAAARKLKVNNNHNNNNSSNSNNNNNNSITRITNTSSPTIAKVISNGGIDKIRINSNHVHKIIL